MAMARTVVRWVVAWTPAAMALLFIRAGIDLFTTVKATAAVLAAVTALAASVVIVAAGAASGRGTPRPSGAATTALRSTLPLLVLAIGAATLLAPSPLRALVGEAGRHSGAAAWLAAIALAVAAHSTARRDGGRLLSAVTIAAVLPLGGYALVQALGADPLEWSRVEGGPQVFSTLGNADFLSAWLGMVTPLAVAAALDADRDLSHRLVALGALPVAFGAAVASGSLQGPVAALIGSAVVIATWASDTTWRRRARVTAGSTVVVLVAGVVLLGLIDIEGSPRALLRSAERSVETRTPLWSAALSMAGAQPLTGVGPGHFIDEWFSARPAWADAALSIDGGDEPLRLAAALQRPVDDAHAVPLHLAATAGIPAAVLGVAALAVVVVSAASALFTGPSSPAGGRRMTLGGYLGAVVAAAAVATVSVDVAPLTVTGAVLAGATAGLAVRAGERGDEGVGAATEPPDGAAGWTAGWTTVGLVGGMALTGLAVVPLVADVIAGTAVAAAARGDTATAGRRWEQAADLAPWERRYPSGHSAALARQGAVSAALRVQRRAAARAPRNRAVLLDLARLTAVVEGPQAALGAYRRVVTVDPHTPGLLAEAARNALRADRPVRAAELLRRAVDAGADPADVQELLRGAEAAASTG